MLARHRPRGVGSLASIAALGLLVGCNALLGTDTAESTMTPTTPTAPVEDGGVDGTSDVKPNPELGDPPPDAICKSLWTDARDKTKCQNRWTMPIHTGIHAPGGLAIERTPSGRTVIAYPRDTGSEQELVDVVQFTDRKNRSTSSIGAGFTRFGQLALAKWANDGVLLAAHSATGKIVSVTELDKDGPARPGETVASNIAEPAYVDIATNGANAYVAYFDPTLKKLFLRGRHGATSKWSTPAAADSEFVTDGLAGSGQVSLQVDDSGAAHVAYHKALFRTTSAVDYRVRSGDAWANDAATVDLEGAAGFSVAFAMFGDGHYAAYFASTTSGASTELRFTKWGATVVDGKSTELIIHDLIVEDPLKPYTRVAMAIDPWGLVHLAVAAPQGFGIDISYYRQTIVQGEKVWLADTVASIPLTKGMAEPLVAIAVDDQARPHIAYHSSADDTVYYATDDK